jgi:hypothetical protein
MELPENQIFYKILKCFIKNNILIKIIYFEEKMIFIIIFENFQIHVKMK